LEDKLEKFFIQHVKFDAQEQEVGEAVRVLVCFPKGVLACTDERGLDLCVEGHV
jgi:hypothetical protein